MPQAVSSIAPSEKTTADSAYLYVQFESFGQPLFLPPIDPPLAKGTKDERKMPPPDQIKRLKVLIEHDPLEEIAPEDKARLWQYRHFVLSSAQALPSSMKSADGKHSSRIPSATTRSLFQRLPQEHTAVGAPTSDSSWGFNGVQ